MSGFIRTVVASGAIALSSAAIAAQTDIADTPISTASTISAKPNIMFVLDDSGSMNWSFMPDALGISLNSLDLPFASTYGYASSQCNGVAYNPATTYAPPPYASGALYPAATFGSAAADGFVATSATTNLNNSVYYTYKGSNLPMSWTYGSNGPITTTSFYNECLSNVGSAPGSSVFTAVTVTSTSAEAQNYANWYSYYRKRYLTMRSNVGRAFSALDSTYRVGFSVISDTGVTSGTHNFLDVSDFTTQQKAAFYTSLYTSTSFGSTPLRQSMGKVGQYFAKKVAGQSVDPMQYSCQRNYAILATDGAWNGSAATQLDGSTPVGQQDGTEAPPMFDGNYAASTVVNTWGYWETDVMTPPGINGCPAASSAVRLIPMSMSETDQLVAVPSANGTLANALMPSFSGVYLQSGQQIYNCRDPLTLKTHNFINGVPYSIPGETGSYYFSSVFDTNVPVPAQVILSSGAAVASSNRGPFDTLADVTEYYYKTDLRDPALGNCTGALGTDVCANTLAPSGLDIATWQHMTTFTIGLGVNGTLAFDQNYLTATTGVFADISKGLRNWPVPDGGAANIDDLWHAAVNGRGEYFAALSSDQLSNAIRTALAAANVVTGTAVGAGVSSLQPTQGATNEGFVSSFKTNEWTGDVRAHPMDFSTGVVDTTKLNWSAQKQLDAQSAGSRSIYYARRAGSALSLIQFTRSNLKTDGYNGWFDNFCSQPSIAAQCAAFSAAQLSLANSGDNLVSYLSGDPSNEALPSSTTSLYRTRPHKLGDIVNAAPAYVGIPRFSYVDAGYADFVTAQAARKPVVYAAANDGMLHAFSDDANNGAAEGNELWAYIPTMVLPKLYRLADTAYATKHQFLVDGSPQEGDIQVGGSWKTILVGGLGVGGSGYYALDITDSTKPLVLWEFTDANLGLSIGNPVIAKLKNGTWVVALSSGYNNADGLGHLFILDANTGSKLSDMVTTAGSPASPSGLSKISAYVDDVSDNTAMYFYGGDLLGNLWRFDIDHRISEEGTGVTLLASFQLNATTPQPITTSPFPIQITTGSASSAPKLPGVLVSTGRYLGTSDVSDKTQQSIYVVKDPLTTQGLGDVRASGLLVDRAVTLSGSTSTLAATTSIDWSTADGWKLDLPKSGERIVVDPVVQFSTTALISLTPGGTVCPPTMGGSSLYLLNVNTGASLLPSSAGFLTLSQPAVGIAWVSTGSGNVIERTNADGTMSSTPVPVTSAAAPMARRTSWRELVD